MGNRLSWRFFKKKRRSRQNPRPSTRLGKIEAETVYHGDFPKKAALTPKPEGARGKTKQKPFIMAMAKKRAIGLAKSFGSAKPFGSAKQKGVTLVIDRSRVEEVRNF